MYCGGRNGPLRNRPRSARDSQVLWGKKQGANAGHNQTKRTAQSGRAAPVRADSDHQVLWERKGGCHQTKGTARGWAVAEAAAPPRLKPQSLQARGARSPPSESPQARHLFMCRSPHSPAVSPYVLWRRGARARARLQDFQRVLREPQEFLRESQEGLERV